MVAVRTTMIEVEEAVDFVVGDFNLDDNLAQGREQTADSIIE